MVPAACASWRRPTSVDPVNVSLRTISEVAKSVPIAPEDREGTTEKTPGGTPARAASSASASALRGVAEAGFRTTGQPAASAAPLRCAGRIEPLIRRASSAKQRI